MFETDWSEEWGIYFLFSNSRSTGVSDMWAQFPALHSSCLTPFFCPLLFLSYLPSLFSKSLQFLVYTLTNPTLQRGWGSPGCKTLWASNSMFAVDILWFFSSPFHRGFSFPLSMWVVEGRASVHVLAAEQYFVNTSWELVKFLTCSWFPFKSAVYTWKILLGLALGSEVSK